MSETFRRVREMALGAMLPPPKTPNQSLQLTAARSDGQLC